MDRRSFLRNSGLATGAVLSTSGLKAGTQTPTGKDIFELKVYYLNGAAGRNRLKKFYSDAVIPFLKKRGTKVAAFSEYSLEEPPVMYVLHAHQSIAEYYDAMLAMRSDSAFLEAAGEYIKIPPATPVYNRFETFLMEAFDGLPHFNDWPDNNGLVEMRTYESYSEDAGIRKVKMFNDGEIQLFEKLGFHPVMFGQHLAGQYMPALTYMLSFKDMDERDALWATFGPSPEWKEMSSKEEYANTVSKIHKKFLLPADFS